MSKIIRNIQEREKTNDLIYTPKPLALDMIKLCDIKETDKVLDCSLGGGVFYDNFPVCERDWCEIDRGRDFFVYTKNKKYDWVIGNPPYSLWTKWLDHTCKITDKFCYIFGVYNLTPSRLGRIFDNGFGITSFTICKVDWWFSPSYLVVFEKNKKSIINNIKTAYKCDICGKICNRGRNRGGKKYGMNVCSNI
jgi:hypothetical protein